MFTVETVDQAIGMTTRAALSLFDGEQRRALTQIWCAADYFGFRLNSGMYARSTVDGPRLLAELHTVVGKLLQVRASLVAGPMRHGGQLVMDALAEMQRIHGEILEAA